jgi:hypothetical protein
MGFREWLLNEDPDELMLGDGFLPWYEGLTFFVLDGLFLYGPVAGDTLHGDIEKRARDCAGEIAKSMESGDPSHALKCVECGWVKAAGRPTARSMELLKYMSEKPRVRGGLDRLVQGRIWPDHRAISFWNPLGVCRAAKGHVFDFIREMGGNPEEYRYEAGDVLMDYGEFVGFRNVGVRSGFDPSKVHTMLPGPVKGQLMGAMGFMRSKPVDVRTRAAREGD